MIKPHVHILLTIVCIFIFGAVIPESVSARVHNKKRGESIALVYQPCAKFSRGQVGVKQSE